MGSKCNHMYSYKKEAEGKPEDVVPEDWSDGVTNQGSPAATRVITRTRPEVFSP